MSTSGVSDGDDKNNQITRAGADPQALQEELLGPSYDYAKQIFAPGEIGMSARGTLSALAKDIGGLISYTQLLVSGGGSASAVDGPLGNKFFLETAAKCKDVGKGTEETRYIYVNNQADGSIPFISAGLDGTTFGQFKGIIPGVMSNIAHINPFQILQAFTSGPAPECQALQMDVIDVNNNVSRETHYVTNTDIAAMPACWFPGGRNIVTNKTCRETFTSSMDTDNMAYEKMPNDLLSKLYVSGISLVALYIFYRLFQRKTKG
jgi:hypothetical protein